ncbi:predicted protein [Arabidopsis lyrata subsp. lyrata]|uniref:Predicted protein n=1 Tax=Arabidopsis lyrata subsp. lyrata TaxID=81972 RepID=D7L2I1_ARALL|nr:predicted protein [Arabidopsis lyrata subsp. lyrata]
MPSLFHRFYIAHRFLNVSSILKSIDLDSIYNNIMNSTVSLYTFSAILSWPSTVASGFMRHTVCRIHIRACKDQDESIICSLTRCDPN